MEYELAFSEKLKTAILSQLLQKAAGIHLQ